MPATPTPELSLSAAPNTGSIVTLFLVLALLIVAAYFTTRFVGGKTNRFYRSKHMQILDRLNISKDKAMIILHAGEKHYLLGVTAQRISLIDTLDPQTLTEMETPKTDLPSWMQKFMQKRGRTEEDTAERQGQGDTLDDMERRMRLRAQRRQESKDKERGQ